MNNNYYENPIYKDYNQNIYPLKEEYIDTIINKNHGKKAKIYITIPGSTTWQDKEFTGIIESASKDHIVISNPSTGEWNIIPIIYLAYITLEEPINYN